MGRCEATLRWGGTVAAVWLCALVTPDALRADPEGELLGALRESELVYSRTGSGAYLVVFEADRATGVSTWPVVVTTVGGDEWVLVYATLIDAETEDAFGERILRRALTYNAQTAGSKLALDASRGDLDVQYEIPMTALSPTFLRDMVHDVVTTCDSRHDEFRDLLTSP